MFVIEVLCEFNLVFGVFLILCIDFVYGMIKKCIGIDYENF